LFTTKTSTAPDWVSVEGTTIKINRFKAKRGKKEEEKDKKEPLHKPPHKAGGNECRFKSWGF
jgi:hypothetical protein